MDITQRKPSISTGEPIRSLSVTDGEITLLPKQAYCARLTQSSASIGFAFKVNTRWPPVVFTTFERKPIRWPFYRRVVTCIQNLRPAAST